MNSLVLLDLIPEDLKSKNGTIKFNPTEAPLIGVYFSAHWCPPCKAFTPMLASFYEAANKTKKQIEIIFASSDSDEGQYNEYYNTMPWIAIPFGDEAKKLLSETYGVEGIPTFIVFDNKGKVVDGKARTTVQNRFPKNGYVEQTAQTIINIWNGINP